MVVKELQVLAHRRSIFLHQYLDDCVVGHLELQTAGTSSRLLFNWAKSVLVPSKDFLFGGYRFLTEENVVCPSE